MGTHCAQGLSFRRYWDLSSSFLMPYTLLPPPRFQRVPWLCCLARVLILFFSLIPVCMSAGPSDVTGTYPGPLSARAALLAAHSEPRKEEEKPGKAVIASGSWSAFGSGLRQTPETRGESAGGAWTDGGATTSFSVIAAFSSVAGPRLEGPRGSLAHCLRAGHTLLHPRGM